MSERPTSPLLFVDKVAVTLPGKLLDLKDLPLHIAEPTVQMLSGSVELILSTDEPDTRKAIIGGMIRQLQIAQEKGKSYLHLTSQED